MLYALAASGLLAAVREKLYPTCLGETLGGELPLLLSKPELPSL